MGSSEFTHRPLHMLHRLVSLLVILLLLYAAVFSWQSWQEEKAVKVETLVNLMELEEHAIDSYFGHIEHSMGVLARDVVESSDARNLDGPFSLIRKYHDLHPEFHNINVIGTDGQILFTAKTTPHADLPSFAQHPSFMKFQQEMKENHPLDIGQPLVGPISNRWIIPFRYQVRSREGTLACIISANLPVELLKDFWKDAPFIKTAALGLLRDDGYLVSRFPVPPNIQMAEIYGKPRTGALIQHLREHQFPVSGYVQGHSGLEERDFLFAFRRLEHFPITLFILMPLSEVRALWWDKVKVPYSLSAILLLVGIFAYRLTLSRQRAREIEQWQASEALKNSKAFLDTVIDQSPVAMWISDERGTFLRGNKALREILNVRDDELIGKYNIFQDNLVEELGFMPRVHEVFEEGRTARFTVEYDTSSLANVKLAKSKHAVLDVTLSPVLDTGGRVTNAIIQFFDVSEQKEAEAALRESEQHFRNLADSGQAMIWTSGVDKACDYFNRTWLEFTGRTPEQEMGDGWTRGVHPEDLDGCVKVYTGAFDRRETFSMVYRLRRHDGEYRWIQDDGTPRYDTQGGFLGYIGHCLDITDKMIEQEERHKLQEQLHQAQKIEAVGRLAGGVAHDFNNMLGVILGHVELALEQVHPSTGRLRRDLLEIEKAAHRSADLTRQLLAFARKQTVSPQILDLNDTISGMIKMLRRLIGEDIELAWLPGHELWSIRIDPSQVDQILANLAVNARDAIHGVGKVTIETRSQVLDGACCAGRPGLVPGEYVILTVSDTGVGMGKDVLQYIFEPFFTTKEVGKGTGLGLATVYGIVKQNGGFINVTSEAGRGTTFTICFPRFLGETPNAAGSSTDKPLGGTETILLVEDEESILNLGQRMLDRLGYKVLSASTPHEAIRLVQEYRENIHLLITDVVMPQMNGRELAERLTALKPTMKCLFMSGYTADAIAHHGVLDEGVRFIQKPFSIKTMAEKTREALTG